MSPVTRSPEYRKTGISRREHPGNTKKAKGLRSLSLDQKKSNQSTQRGTGQRVQERPRTDRPARRQGRDQPQDPTRPTQERPSNPPARSTVQKPAHTRRTQPESPARTKPTCPPDAHQEPWPSQERRRRATAGNVPSKRSSSTRRSSTTPNQGCPANAQLW